MSVQVAGLGEFELTQLALIGFFSAVDAQMLGEGARIGKRFFAHSTPAVDGESNQSMKEQGGKSCYEPHLYGLSPLWVLM